MFTKLSTLILFAASSFSVYGQGILINFTGTGESTTVDSVKVENLTQCTSINMSGSDILHLVTEVGIETANGPADTYLEVYPNPTTDLCRFEFEARTAGTVVIGIYDLTGRKIAEIVETLRKGIYAYQIKGLGKGVYTLRICAESYGCQARIISINSNVGTLEITKADSKSTSISGNRTKEVKSEKSLIDMQYNAGDLLKLTGSSGLHRTVVMLVPGTDQTVTFTFIPCTDTDGNSYAIVQIGAQWWMAENLNAGTYVPITTPQAAGTKFCMNINGQDDPTCPMGGLYEWNVLMQETPPCNGTGAPPNDRCTSPVKGLCPDGWHIPSHFEWTTLAQNAGSNFGALDYRSNLGVGVDEGGPLKMNCTASWWNPNAGATNATGFSGIPGGDTWNGVFEDFGQSSYYWTSSAIFTYTYNPWVYALNYSVPFVGRSQYFKENGFSCRCVKD